MLICVHLYLGLASEQSRIRIIIITAAARARSVLCDVKRKALINIICAALGYW